MTNSLPYTMEYTDDLRALARYARQGLGNFDQLGYEVAFVPPITTPATPAFVAIDEASGTVRVNWLGLVLAGVADIPTAEGIAEEINIEFSSGIDSYLEKLKSVAAYFLRVDFRNLAAVDSWARNYSKNPDEFIASLERAESDSRFVDLRVITEFLTAVGVL